MSTARHPHSQVTKKKKSDLENEVERISVGSTVWVELQAPGINPAAAATFDGNSKGPFALASVISIEGDTVIVCPSCTTARAAVPARAVALADLGDPRLNNLQLLHLNEPNLLNNVRARFLGGEIYVCCLPSDPWEVSCSTLP